MLDHVLAGLAVVFGAIAMGRSFMRKKLTLPQIAALACDHGEHAETRTMPRWKLAYEAGTRLDLDDNGREDYTPAQRRIAIDAEAKRRGWAAQS
jgi:hypothetical protein